MTRQEVLESLCYYDIRNPYNVLDKEEIKDHNKKDCYCDNCFKGKTKLAEELLKYIYINN